PERYMCRLSARHDVPVLLKMEQLGHERLFPIAGRLVGEPVEVLALSIGATRVCLRPGAGAAADRSAHSISRRTRAWLPTQLPARGSARTALPRSTRPGRA